MLLMLFKDLKLSPLRSFLTAFSMFIGIIAIVTSVLVGTIGKAYFVGTTEQRYGRTPTYSISFESPHLDNPQRLEKLLQRLNVAQADLTLLLNPDKALFFSSYPTSSPDADAQRKLLAEPKAVETNYVTSGYNKIYRLPLLKGEWLQTSTLYPRLEAVVNQAAETTFPLNSFAFAFVSHSLNLTPIPVIGVVNDGRNEPNIYINISGLAALTPTLLARHGKILWHENIINTSNNDKISFISDALTDTTGGSVGTVSYSDSASYYQDALGIVQLAFLLTAVLLLLVSMLGLINIGLSTLEQRSHELLIRRALGASRGNIAWLVLGSSILLAGLVSAVAVLFSALIVTLVPFALSPGSPVDPPSYPYTAAIYAIVAATLTAVLGSLLPAIKASRLEPALALR